MGLKLMGKKHRMVQRFDETGSIVVCTIIHVEPNVVTQIKSIESDGYNAIQLGFDKIVIKDPRTMEKRITKPLIGHFKKSNVDPRRYLAESRIDIDGYSVGQLIGVSFFDEVSYVDITGISKGKGYQGVMKKYHFAGGPAAHGSGFHRHGGSTGMRSTPGRTLPGQKKAGQMGCEQVTVQNLRLVCIDEKQDFLLVEGAVPGHLGGLVSISPACKKKSKSKVG
ncbi:MAG: 50S ribosomal protein L3 [Chlamydiales bacterium]